MTQHLRTVIAVAALFATAACHGESEAAAGRPLRDARPASSAGQRSRMVIDSALPMNELLRRFRAPLNEVRSLDRGARSREELVRRFAAALERADTPGLDGLLVTRAEFAYLVLPTSPLVKPPYNQPPEIGWMLLRLASDKGLRRLLARHAGRPLGVERIECPDSPAREGENRLWRGCALLLRDGEGVLARRRLFGPILERDDRFRFLSYENDL